MKRQYYAIKDNLAEAFMMPILFENENTALRWFSGVVNSETENKIIYDNPGDYELWKLASFDNQSGEITTMLEKIATGLSVKKGV